MACFNERSSEKIVKIATTIILLTLIYSIDHLLIPIYSSSSTRTILLINLFSSYSNPAGFSSNSTDLSLLAFLAHFLDRFHRFSTKWSHLSRHSSYLVQFSLVCIGLLTLIVQSSG